jgi:hypothetical protein
MVITDAEGSYSSTPSGTEENHRVLWNWGFEFGTCISYSGRPEFETQVTTTPGLSVLINVVLFHTNVQYSLGSLSSHLPAVLHCMWGTSCAQADGVQNCVLRVDVFQRLRLALQPALLNQMVQAWGYFSCKKESVSVFYYTVKKDGECKIVWSVSPFSYWVSDPLYDWVKDGQRTIIFVHSGVGKASWM